MFAYRVSDPAALWRRDVRRGRPRDPIEEKPASRSPTGRSPASISTTMRSVDIAARLAAVGARRTRDHRSQPRLSRARSCWPSSGWAAAIAWLDTGTPTPARGCQFRADRREAAGPQDRLPRGDRAQSRLYRDRSGLALAKPIAKTEYGRYLLQLSDVTMRQHERRLTSCRSRVCRPCGRSRRASSG